MTETNTLTLHREVETKRGRLKIFALGALLGALVTSAGTFELARINTQCDRIHAKHRLEHLRADHARTAHVHRLGHEICTFALRSHP